jgi:hypothetical protein
MKLRVRGNSLRIRVSRAELDSIASRGVAADEVRFAPGTSLLYGVEVIEHGELSARFADGEVRVFLPRAAVDRWLDPDEISIHGEQSLAGGEALRILVEKDFTCLAPREGEDDSDLFPNPQKAGALT